MDAMRRPSSILVLASLVVALTACGVGPSPTPPGRTLTIVHTLWNGWDQNYTPKPKTTTMPATVGAETTIEDGFDVVTIRVAKADATSVTVTLSEGMAARSAGGGIALGDIRTEYTVTAGQITSFATPTLDQGVTFDLTLS